MDGEKFRIKLTDNAQPFCVNTPRYVLYAFQNKLKEEIALLEAHGVIKAVTDSTEWCAPIVVTPKKDSDDVRLCVDFSKLNNTFYANIITFAHPRKQWPILVIDNVSFLLCLMR